MVNLFIICGIIVLILIFPLCKISKMSDESAYKEYEKLMKAKNDSDKELNE